MNHKTPTTKGSEIKRTWHLFDAKDQVLGRLATRVARVLIGKDKVNFSPNLDGGDYVVVVNAKAVKVTGKKELDKRYYHHSGFPGGLKTLRLEEVREKDARRLIREAVAGMLPQNRLRSRRLARLKVFNEKEHIHQNHFIKAKELK